MTVNALSIPVSICLSLFAIPAAESAAPHRAIRNQEDAPTAGASEKASPSLRLRETIELPDVKGRMDHLALNGSGERLYVAALENGTLEVVDLRAGERVQTIHDLEEPQGIIYLAKSNRVVVACGGDGAVVSYDADTLKELSRVKVAGDADNLRLDATRGLLYLGFGDGALAALDPDRLTQRNEIRLAGHPESFQLDEETGRASVNIPDTHEIAVVDLTKQEVIEHWPVSAASANYPMALDREGHRLFVACRLPPRLLTIDLRTGNTMESNGECVGDADDAFLDAGRKRLYVLGGDGFVDVYSLAMLGVPRIEHVPTSPGARTGLLVPDRNRLYVLAPARGGRSAMIQVFEVSP